MSKPKTADQAAEEKAESLEKTNTNAEKARLGRQDVGSGLSRPEGDGFEPGAAPPGEETSPTASVPTGSGDRASSENDVYVFANLKQAISFRLSRDESVTVKGLPVSELRQPGGGFFAGGKYGVTVLPAEQWERIIRIYGKMKIFQNGLVFAAPSLERGKAMARERGGLRHGYEPVDPDSARAKTTPKTEE